jgi:anaerobic selenocysteine-containing dehydrogenase
MTEHPTYCRICEPTCGMVATVGDGRLVQLRPDAQHPITKGFSCPKGIEFVHVQNDPDRLLHPMRRTASGEFERISWQTALDEIGAKLRAIRARHGGASIGWYAGNLTDDVAPGTVAVPHGWGHRGAGWQTANAAGGANVNELTSSRPEDLERLSGMAHLNGVAVRLERVPALVGAP